MLSRLLGSALDSESALLSIFGHETQLEIISMGRRLLLQVEYEVVRVYLFDKFLELEGTRVRRVADLEVPGMLDTILALPTSKHDVNDIFLLLNVGYRVGSIPHRLDEQEDGAISHHIMILLCHEVRIT